MLDIKIRIKKQNDDQGSILRQSSYQHEQTEAISMCTIGKLIYVKWGNQHERAQQTNMSKIEKLI